MTRRKLKPRRIRIVWIAAIADHEVSVAAIHHDCIEPQNATITSSADRTFLDRASTFGEQPIDNLHLRDEALRIDYQIGLASIVINGKHSRDAGSLRKDGRGN